MYCTTSEYPRNRGQHMCLYACVSCLSLPCDTEHAAEQSRHPLGDDHHLPQGGAVHGDEHEGGVAPGYEDVDGAVVSDAQDAANVR